MEHIKQRNDKLRKTLTPNPLNRIVLTASVAESPHREKILEAVRTFDSFSSGNDPHGEHDFGDVVVEGRKYFFKFDYYDLSFEYGADPYTEEYALVLTIMDSSEY